MNRYHILEINPELMGGGPRYLYVTTCSSKEDAQAYIQYRKDKHSQEWEDNPKQMSRESWESWSPRFIITRECGQDGNAADC